MSEPQLRRPHSLDATRAAPERIRACEAAFLKRPDTNTDTPVLHLRARAGQAPSPARRVASARAASTRRPPSVRLEIPETQPNAEAWPGSKLVGDGRLRRPWPAS